MTYRLLLLHLYVMVKTAYIIVLQAAYQHLVGLDMNGWWGNEIAMALNGEWGKI